MRKLHECDGCGKLRVDVKSVGRDANNEPDAPDLCFLCREEWRRHRKVFDKKLQRYVYSEES